MESGSQKVTLSDFGKIESSHFAYSCDEGVRFRASSGGFIKSFLVFLIEKGIVDYAIITRTGDSSRPLVPETVITNDKDEILSSRTNSVYMPHNVFSIFRELDPDKEYAVVGLPCQVKHLWELQGVGEYWNIPVVISLFCYYTPTLAFTRRIIESLNLRPEDIVRIEYRGNGWPGGFTAYLKDGEPKFIPSGKYWSNDLRNGPRLCSRCFEVGAYADITVGDPWNLQLKDTKGTSLVICRNNYSSRLVREASDLGYIEISDCSLEQLLKSQGSHIQAKLDRRRTQERSLAYRWAVWQSRTSWQLRMFWQHLTKKESTMPLP